MLDYLLASSLIFLLLLGWILVQQAARHFAQRHPQFGPVKEEGSGCGKSCQCKNSSQCKYNKTDLNTSGG